MNRCLALVTLALAGLAATLLIQRPLFARPAAAFLAIRPPMVTTLKQITAADGMWDDRFGTSVAISVDIVVIGAWLADVGFFPDQGAAYLFERNAGSLDHWGQVKKLLASDARDYEHFGSVVAMSGNVVVVGAPDARVNSQSNQGAVYVFARNTGGMDHWGQVKKLVADDGDPEDVFGDAVAIDGNTVVVGARGDDVGANSEQGSAYVFERNAGGTDHWGQVRKLVASDGAAFDQFGRSVAVNGEVVVAGSPADDAGSITSLGAAYVFARNQGGAANWGEVKKLVADDGEADDRFGWSVLVSGETIVVGAPRDDIEADVNQGSIYISERHAGGGDNWGQVDHLSAGDGAADDRFGYAVAISLGSVAIGAVLDDVGSNVNQGSAYLYLISPPAKFYLPLIAR